MHMNYVSPVSLCLEKWGVMTPQLLWERRPWQHLMYCIVDTAAVHQSLWCIVMHYLQRHHWNAVSNRFWIGCIDGDVWRLFDDCDKRAFTVYDDEWRAGMRTGRCTQAYLEMNTLVACEFKMRCFEKICTRIGLGLCREKVARLRTLSCILNRFWCQWHK